MKNSKKQSKLKPGQFVHYTYEHLDEPELPTETIYGQGLLVEVNPDNCVVLSFNERFKKRSKSINESKINLIAIEGHQNIIPKKMPKKFKVKYQD